MVLSHAEPTESIGVPSRFPRGPMARQVGWVLVTTVSRAALSVVEDRARTQKPTRGAVILVFMVWWALIAEVCLRATGMRLKLSLAYYAGS